jgi:hypothetical protein
MSQKYQKEIHELLDFSFSTPMSVIQHRIVKSTTRNFVIYKTQVTHRHPSHIDF